MSPRTLTMSLKGRRTHGKPSRFDPSEPLHMTTRHAARNGRHNTSSSVSGSNGSDESRRASFDDPRPTTSYSLGSQPSEKGGRRLSTISFNRIPDISHSFETHSTIDNKSEAIENSPHFQPSSPTRKRKRSSPTPPGTPNGMSNVDVPVEDKSTYLEDGDSIEVTPIDRLSDRESDRSSNSETPSPRGYAAMAQSTEMTPAVSEAASPVSEQSSVEVNTPEKRLTINVADVDQVADPEDFEEAEDLPDAEDGDEADDIDDGDDQARADAEGRPRRRFAGRRRADHHIPEIEALMRRQSHLKSAFRAITRALKPVLAEIALKTVEDLEANPNLHEQVVEYEGTDQSEGIPRLLDTALEKRKAQLQAQYSWSRAQLGHTFEAETAVRKDGYRQQVKGLQEVHLDQLRHDFLAIARKAQFDEQDTRNETEDEDGDVVMKLKGMGYRFRRKGAVDSRCESRSRVAMEVQQAIGDLQARIQMHKLLQESPDAEPPAKDLGFTVMDSAPRDAALFRRESLENTKTLARAAKQCEKQAAEEKRKAAEAERKARIPVIRNEEVPGLQMLGELASRPSLRASVLPRPNEHLPFLGHPTPPQMPPPPLRPPIGRQTPPFEMYPREPSYQDRIGQLGPQPTARPRPGSQPDVLNREPQYSPASSRVFHGSPLPPLMLNIAHNESPKHMDSRGHSQIAGQDSIRHRRHHSDIYNQPLGTPRDAEILSAGVQVKEDAPWDVLPRPIDSHPRFRPLFPLPTDRPIHEPLRVVPLTREDTKAPEVKPTPRPSQFQDQIKNESPRSQGYLPKPSMWEPPSSPGAIDSRHPHPHHIPAPAQERNPVVPNPSLDAAKVSHTRTPSVSQSGTDFSPKGGQPSEPPRRQRSKTTKTGPYTKTNKTERNGYSRKQFKRYDTGSSSKKSPATTDGPSIHRFRLNPAVEPTPQPQPLQAAPPPPPLPPASWGGTPPSMPAYPGRPGEFQYPPPPSYSQGPPLPPPPPHATSQAPSSAQYRAYSPEYGSQQHRNSFPPSTNPGPQPWANLPPSPLYAVPRGPSAPAPAPSAPAQSGPTQGPPPQSTAPGPPDHSWPPPGQQSQYGPQPPRPGDHRASMTPQPPTTFGPQFGGPAIAPAPPLTDTRFIMGSVPPPAFAQQQRQQDGPSARRRTQSETFAKFQHYSPRGRS